MNNAVLEELSAAMMRSALGDSASSLSSPKTADDDYVPTAFELIASEILDTIQDIREIHESGSLPLEQTKEQLPASEKPKTSPKHALERGIWPFKHFISSSGPAPSAETELMNGENALRDGWDDLLDSAAEATNHIMMVHVVIETEDSLKAKTPPLFWLLYSGHAYVQFKA